MGLLTDIAIKLTKSAAESAIKTSRDKNIKGKLGESFTAAALAWSKLFGRDGIVLRNVYIPKEDSDTAEIDLLFITRKGIFVIESKNYSGIITGTDLEKQWTAVMFSKNDMRKFLFYNPVMQNVNHVKSLRRILDEPNVPMFSFIVFSDRCSISGVTTSADNTYVCNLSQLNKLIDTIWNQNLDALTELQVSSIAAQLEPLTKVSTEVKEKHIASVSDKYGTNKEICPKCGGILVRRIAKTGRSAGREFLGCSNYPNCRFTRNI